MTLCEELKDTRVSTRLRRTISGLRYLSSPILASSAIHNTKLHTLTKLRNTCNPPFDCASKYVHSVRRPTAGLTNQALWEARSWYIWQNMLLLYILVSIIMRRASEASLFFLGFPREKKPLHNGSYEHRVPKNKKQNIILYQGCLCV